MHIKRLNSDDLPDVFWATIDPETAKYILEQPFMGNGLIQQREIKVGAVNYYAEEITSGRWMAEECSPIKLTNELAVVDGQHRLRAILQANASITALVAVGTPLDAAIPTTVNPKQTTHILQMAGYKSAKTLSSLLRSIWRLENFGWTLTYSNSGGSTSRPMSTTEVLPFAKAHTDAELDLAWAHKVRQRFVTMGIGITALSFSSYILRNLDDDLSGEFLAKLASGASMDEGDLILMTRQCLMSFRDRMSRTGGGRVDQRLVLATVIRAWNLFVSGKTLARMSPVNPQREKWPIPIDPETMTSHSKWKS